MNIEANIASSVSMSIGTKIGHPDETSTEAKIETAHAEIPIDIVTTTRTHPLGAMMDFLRRRGIAIVRVAGMVESRFGWCSNHVIAVGNLETWFRVWGARESEAIVEPYRGCIGDVNKQRGLGDTQCFFAHSQQHLDELCAETPAAISRRNDQAAEVTSPGTQVELAKPTQFKRLPDQSVGRETRQFRVIQEALNRERETEFRAAPNAAAVLGPKPRHYLRHVSFRCFDELCGELGHLHLVRSLCARLD
jgi:hypothetical protein